MNATQRAMARHALGLPNDQRRSYRNRYFVPNGTAKASEWVNMEAAGLAECQSDPLASQMWFILTRMGAQAALNEAESLCMEDFPPAPEAAP
jgi:hypothetical protein